MRTRKKHGRFPTNINLRVWAGEQVFETTGLDSSLKKNTAFIKRLRSIGATTVQTLQLEIRTLSLHKYLSEIISACAEGLARLKTPQDVAAGVEVASALHQRFGHEFTPVLAALLAKGLAIPDKNALKSLTQEARDKEERERYNRQRLLTRVTTELWLVGVLRGVDDVQGADKTSTQPFPLETLKELLGRDREHQQLPMVVLFVKSFAWDVLRIGEEPEEPLTPPDLAERFRSILTIYFEDVKKQLVRDQKAINNQAKKNAEAYVKSGEIFEDRQANFERQTKALEKLVTNAQIVADVLELDMPDLAEKEAESAAPSIGLVNAADYLKGDGAGIWEDEEERVFYESLIDLKERVPAILLEDKRKKEAGKEDEADAKEDGKDDTESEALANKTVGAQVDGLLVRLPEMTNKEAVDQMALDFCFLNSKASRNRLVKALVDVPRGRVDLLPLYARLVATLGKYMLDIPQAIVSHLDAEFRSLQRRKGDNLAAVRTINIRYLSELTKFGVVPVHVVFHSLKVSLDDFSKLNIEIICDMLENCGRYLFRFPETAPRMVAFLETLQRKKTAQHLGQQEKMLIENALYYVNPPERPAIQQKERSPVELFIRRLVYIELNKRTYGKILKQIRKLHWEEAEVVTMLDKIFTKPWKVKYSNIHLLAILLGSLYRYHQDFVIRVIDEILEQITVALENLDFKQGQRRVAVVKYLGELYNYKMVDSPVIFDTLYKIVTFGYPGGTPRPGLYNHFDPPDDFSRIRLVCSLLESCGMCFDRGSARKKLDFFLTFFQYYIAVKEGLPLDVEFLVVECFALLRPKWTLTNSFEEAARRFGEAVSTNYKEDRAAEPEEEPEPDEEPDDDLSSEPDEELQQLDDELSESETSQNTDWDDETIVVSRPVATNPEADAEFDRELAKLTAESLDSRKFERKALFDVPLPMRKTEKNDPEESTVAFSLLTKRGNKQQTRTVELPSDSTFAVAMRTQQEAERSEQQRIKNLVLNYELREEDEAQEKGPSRTDRGGAGRSSQRARKLQLSDVNW